MCYVDTDMQHSRSSMDAVKMSDWGKLSASGEKSDLQTRGATIHVAKRIYSNSDNILLINSDKEPRHRYSIAHNTPPQQTETHRTCDIS